MLRFIQFGVIGLVLHLATQVVNSSMASLLKPCLEVGEVDRMGVEGQEATHVLLVPGAGARGVKMRVSFVPVGEYFSAWSETLDDLQISHSVLAADPEGLEGVSGRLSHLESAIENLALQGKRVLLIGHSFGGVAARIALSKSELSQHVSALITVSSPHFGTPLADWSSAPGKRKSFLSALGKVFRYDVNRKRYLEDLRTDRSSEWITRSEQKLGFETPVFSVVTWEKPYRLLYKNPVLWAGAQIIRLKMRHVSSKNPKTPWGSLSDGTVPASSQVYGHCLGQVQMSHMGAHGKSLSRNERKRSRALMKELVSEMQARHFLK